MGSYHAGKLLAPTGSRRESRFDAACPPCQSSTAASAPWRCTPSTMSACARTSSSSQSVAVGIGSSSELGWIEQYSVETTPQPPSALTARIAASDSGRA